MKTVFIAFVFLVLGAGSMYVWNLFDTNNKQNAARAEKCYAEGENFFNQKNYKAALLSYEEVTEFYSHPHTPWADLAQEKEWICRAYLNDWTPSKGKMVGDMRQLKPHLYEKYKAELMSITPVAPISSMGNTTTPTELTPIATLGFNATPADSTPTTTLGMTATPSDLTPTPSPVS